MWQLQSGNGAGRGRAGAKLAEDEMSKQRATLKPTEAAAADAVAVAPDLCREGGALVAAARDDGTAPQEPEAESLATGKLSSLTWALENLPEELMARGGRRWRLWKVLVLSGSDDAFTVYIVAFGIAHIFLNLFPQCFLLPGHRSLNCATGFLMTTAATRIRVRQISCAHGSGARTIRASKPRAFRICSHPLT